MDDDFWDKAMDFILNAALFLVFAVCVASYVIACIKGLI